MSCPSLFGDYPLNTDLERIAARIYHVWLHANTFFYSILQVHWLKWQCIQFPKKNRFLTKKVYWFFAKANFQKMGKKKIPPFVDTVCCYSLKNWVMQELIQDHLDTSKDIGLDRSSLLNEEEPINFPCFSSLWQL